MSTVNSEQYALDVPPSLVSTHLRKGTWELGLSLFIAGLLQSYFPYRGDSSEDLPTKRLRLQGKRAKLDEEDS